MRRLALLLLCVAGPACAQPRPFNCIGADQLEDDVFAIAFARGAARPGTDARANLAAVAALAAQAPERNLCVLGHAGPQEGGAMTGRDLAARRARAVADALSGMGVERDRIRAEARTAAFARGTPPVPAERSVTIVVLP